MAVQATNGRSSMHQAHAHAVPDWTLLPRHAAVMHMLYLGAVAAGGATW